ncbi:MAG: ATP F0F1 synthase subunit B [Parvibaculaceae bacterium]|nr:ATP F0F1 synthase subunit B [Parvibaculaceae bacterium]
MIHTGEFWVLIGLIVFIAIAVRFKVPSLVAGMLDKRSITIAKEIEDARKLRDEAQQLLATYQRRQKEALQEADDIIVQAKAEAERLAVETRKALESQIERRTKMAEDKIAQAETQAIQEVRAIAADVAVGAARRIIGETLDASKDARLIEKSIGELKSRLH